MTNNVINFVVIRIGLKSNNNIPISFEFYKFMSFFIKKIIIIIRIKIKTNLLQ